MPELQPYSYSKVPDPTVPDSTASAASGSNTPAPTTSAPATSTPATLAPPRTRLETEFPKPCIRCVAEVVTCPDKERYPRREACAQCVSLGPAEAANCLANEWPLSFVIVPERTANLKKAGRWNEAYVTSAMREARISAVGRQVDGW